MSTTRRWNAGIDGLNRTGPRRSARRCRALVVACGVAALVGAALPAQAASAESSHGARFVTIDAPGAGTGTLPNTTQGTLALGTYPSGINDRGQIVGNWYDQNGIGTGFLYDRGRWTAIRDPHEGTGPGQGTDPIDITASGVIVGFYYGAAGEYHGFVLKDGVFTTLNYPGSGTSANTGTIIQGSDQHGELVGLYSKDDGVHHAFIYRKGTWTTVNDPPFPSTFFGSMNNHGSIMGGYTDAQSVHHAALYRNGAFGPAMDDPNAGTTPNAAFTQGTDGFCVTNAGVIAGQYFDPSGTVHGYIQQGKRFRTVDDPFGVGGTSLQCLSDNGNGEGTWYASDGTAHGFIYLARG